MKKFSTLFLFSILGLAAWGQSDNCITATPITIPGSGNVCVTGSNATATSDLTTDACDVAPAGDEVWYTYIVTGSQNTISVSPTGGTPATNLVITLYDQPCGSGFYTTCSSAAGAGTATASWTYTPGTQVWISVETNGTDGGFQLCITSQTPPPAPGNSCATASTICDKNPFSVSSFPANNNAFSPSCWVPTGTSLQQPIFYQFTVGTTGTCEWTCTPATAAEFDFAMYDITSGCPGTVVACNYHFANSVGAPVGLSTTACVPCPVSTVGGGVCREFCAPITVTAGNTYLIIIDNYNNNSVGYSFTWGGTFTMAPVANFTASPTTGCGSLTTTITNSSTAVNSYDWDFGDGTANSSSSNPGTHTYTTPGTYLLNLTATSVSGCTDIQAQTITVNPVPDVTATPASQSICSGSATSIALSSSVAGTTFAWTVSQSGATGASAGSGSSIAQTLTASGTSPGTVTYTVTPTANGCAGTPVNITITVNPIPNATATPSSASICSGTAPSIALSSNVSGATLSWTVTQSGVTGASASSGSSIAQTLTNSGTSNGTATYTVTPSANGCNGSTQTVTITVFPAVTGSSNPASQTICSGNATSLNLNSNVGGASFAWTVTQSGVSGASSGSGSSIAQNLSTTGTVAGTATYTVTPTANGCAGTPFNITVTVNPIPTVTASSNSPVCVGQTINLDASTGLGTYAWTGPNSFSSSSEDPSIAAATLAMSGTYSVTFTVNGCTSTAATTTVTVNSAAVPTITPDGPFCINDGVVTLTAALPGGTWSGTGISNATTGEFDPSSLAPGNYTITYTISGACGGSDTETFTVNTNPNATINSVSGICINDAAFNLTAATGGGTWSGTGITNAAAGTFDPATSGAGTFTITYTIPSPCGASDTYDIVVAPNAAPVVTPAGPYCADADIDTLVADIAGGVWSGNGITDVNNGYFDPAVAGVGTHTITYTTSGTCGGSSSISITVIPSSGPAPSGTQFNTANNGAGSTLPGGANDLNWDVATSLAGPYTDAFVMTPIPGVYFSSPWPDAAWIAHNVDGSHVGNVDYYYRLNIDLPCFNECGFSFADSGVYCLTMDFFTDNSVNEIYVNGIPQSPNQPLIPVANQYFNTGYNAAGGLTIQLCNDWQPGSNELIVKVSSGGPFEGFLAQYSTSSLNQPNDPTISAPGNDTVFCSNDAASTLTAASTGGTWNASCGTCINAAGTFDPATAGQGTHTVTYSTNSLCPATDTITIVVNAYVDASISAAGPYCQNNPADTLTAVNAGGIWSGTGITNSTLGIFNPATAGAGTFLIIYGFAGNCPDADTISVTVNPTPIANAGVDQVLPCVPPTLNLNGSGSSAGTYVWTTPDGNMISGAATNTVTVDAPGTYTLTVTDANGCVNSDAATVTASTPPVASFTANPTTGYFPLVVTTVNTSTGNNLSYLWESDNGESFTSTAPTFTYTNDSTYILTLYVTDINGCTDSSSVTIVVWEEFEILVPNVFSSNGDGVNDVFEVVVKGVQNIDVQIYNRWGNFIYGYDQLNGSWDGKNDGKDCPEGTYFYIITLTKDNGETAGYQGHVTLVR